MMGHRMLSFVLALRLAFPSGTIEGGSGCHGFASGGETNAPRNGGAGTSVSSTNEHNPVTGKAGVRLSAFTCCFTSREV